MSSLINIGRANAWFPRVICETSSVLSAEDDHWTLRPTIFADSLVRRINAYDEASLTYHFGSQMQVPEATNFAPITPFDLSGKYVRLSVYQPENFDDPLFRWVGRAVVESTERGGVESISGDNYFISGDQKFTAVGLEYYLDRRSITSSQIDGKKIERTMIFNGGGLSEKDVLVNDRKNRNSAPVPFSDPPIYEFAYSPANTALWTAKQMIQYLLTYHVEAFPCPIELDENAGDYLDGYTPTVPTDKRTVFQLLNAICSPIRGLCWWLEYDDVENKATIRVQSSAVDPITLPGGGTLAANSEQVHFAFDSQHDISDPKLSRNLSGKYNQIIGRGCRMTATFTLGYADSNIASDWTSTNEQHYKYGAKFETGYGSLTGELKAKSNDAFRRDDKFYRVYSAFRIPSNWDGKSSDGGGTLTKTPAFAKLSPTGSVLGVMDISVNGLRLLNHTVLKRGWDYTDPTSITGNDPSGAAPEYLPPFCFVKIGQVDENNPRFQYLHALNQRQTTDIKSVGNTKRTSYHLRLQHANPGFLIEASNKFNHAAAANHFADAEPSTRPPEIDWHDFRGTFTGEADKFCEGKYPADDPAEPAEILVIDLGDEYRLDYLAKNTVVGIKNGVIQKSEGGVIRDDRKDCEDVARFSWQWYQTERTTCQFGVRQIAAWEHPVSDNPVGIGSLITHFGTGTTQTDLNTLIAQVSYDFNDGHMTITTTGDTLDPRAFALR